MKLLKPADKAHRPFELVAHAEKFFPSELHASLGGHCACTVDVVVSWRQKYATFPEAQQFRAKKRSDEKKKIHTGSGGVKWRTCKGMIRAKLHRIACRNKREPWLWFPQDSKRRAPSFSEAEQHRSHARCTRVMAETRDATIGPPGGRGGERTTPQALPATGRL